MALLLNVAGFILDSLKLSLEAKTLLCEKVKMKGIARFWLC